MKIDERKIPPLDASEIITGREREFEALLDARIGARLREWRMSRGFTMQQVALMLDISHQQLQKIERGENRASAGRLGLLAARYDVPIAYFYDGLFDPEFVTIDTTEHGGRAKSLLEMMTMWRKMSPEIRSIVLMLLRALMAGKEKG